jgi:hypothetical protein
MRVILYKNMYTPASAGEPETLDWSGMMDLLSEPIIVKDKGLAVQIFPGEMLPGTSSKADASVDRIHYYFCDVDAVTKKEYLSTLKRVRDEGLECVVYSSFRHDPKKNHYRVRLVFPLTRPVLVGEWKIFWWNARLLLGGLADPETAHPSKHYLLPSHRPGADGNYIHLHIEGKHLDPDAVIGKFKVEDLAASEVDIHLGSEPVSGVAIDAVLRRPGSRKPEVLATVEAIRAALSGAPYAAEGTRESTLFEIAGFLARKFPRGKVEDLVEPFSVSVQTEARRGGPTIEDFSDKILRKQRFELEKLARRRLNDEKALAKEAKFKDRAVPYTPENLKRYIDRSKGKVTLELLKKQLILVHDNQFFVFNGDGYDYAVVNSLSQVIHGNLVYRAEDHLDFSLYYPTDGEKPPQEKARAHLLRDHGDFVLEVCYTYEGLSYFDVNTKTLWLSRVKRHPSEIQAKFHPEVDEWVSAREEDQAERFKDWLSQVPHTDRPIAGIVCVGVKGSGKTKLAYGLSRLWGAHRPASMQHALGGFNNEMLTCPVVLADESLPETNGRVPTDRIRSLQ